MPQDQLLIFDTTLRDGEQAPGIALTPDEKLAIAYQLAKLNIDVIEAGFAAASDGDFFGVEQISKKVKGPIIVSLARCVPDDIDRALLEPLADACAEEGRYEFMFMGLPLKVAGGTGSPANPIAMF